VNGWTSCWEQRQHSATGSIYIHQHRKDTKLNIISQLFAFRKQVTWKQHLQSDSFVCFAWPVTVWNNEWLDLQHGLKKRKCEGSMCGCIFCKIHPDILFGFFGLVRVVVGAD